MSPFAFLSRVAARTRLILLILLSIMASGCHVFRSSETWRTVTGVKVPGRGQPGGSKVYATGLHRALNGERIENRLVRFRYRVPDYPLPIAVTRWAVIYRDEANPKYPWWFMDSAVVKPVWLPNEPLAKQLHFVVHARPRSIALSAAMPVDYPQQDKFTVSRKPALASVKRTRVERSDASKESRLRAECRWLWAQVRPFFPPFHRAARGSD